MNNREMVPSTNLKEKNVQRVRDEVDCVADAEGKGIERGVKEVVIALEVMELHPQASCEGHLNKGQISAPWVEMAAPNKPNERFVGQNKIFQEVADERGLSFEEVKRSFVPEAYWDAMRRMSKEESEGFQAWEKKNERLLEEAKSLVQEFYATSGEQKNTETRIQFDEGFVGSIFRMYSGGKDYTPLRRDLTEDEKIELRKRLVVYRSEMERFSQFLFEKYYRSK